MDKELVADIIKTAKTKTFYENLQIKSLNMEEEDKVTISGYVNKFLDITGEVISDRDGDAVVTAGINLTNFKSNPIILFNHDRDVIIGKAINTEAKPDGLYMDIEVYKFLNEKVYKALKLGVLNAFSIGFSLKDLTYDEQRDIFFLTDTELLECSVVSVPANAQSLVSNVKGKSLAFTAEAVKSLEKETHQTTLDEVKELIQEVKEQIASLRVKNEEAPEIKDEETEVPDGADETLQHEEKEEPEGASNNTEESKISVLDEVNSLVVDENVFDDLLQAQEVLNNKLNAFLNDNIQ